MSTIKLPNCEELCREHCPFSYCREHGCYHASCGFFDDPKSGELEDIRAEQHAEDATAETLNERN